MAQSNDALNSRKRKAEAHNLKEMCLTSGRRAFLSFAWAAKLLQSPKRRRMAGGQVPWSSFNWLQHTYLHQAVIGALKKPGSGNTGESVPANRAVQPLPAGTRPAGPSQQGVLAGPQEAAEFVDLTLSDASNNAGTSRGRNDAVQPVSPLGSASVQRTASSARRPTASPLAALPPISAADEEPCSARACKGRGVPSALLVGRAGTPLLAALKARRVQPKPSACVATTPAGPSTNLQPLTAADLGRLLRGNGWLNDEVVNFYMLLIMKRELEAQQSPEVAPTAARSTAGVPPPGAGSASTPERVRDTPAARRRQRCSGSAEIEPATSGGAPAGTAGRCRDEQMSETVAKSAPSVEDPAAATAAYLETAAPTALPSPAVPRSPLQHVVSAVAAAAGNSGVAAALAAAMVSTAAGLGAAVAASARRLAPQRRNLESSLAAAAAVVEAVHVAPAPAQGTTCAAEEAVLPSPASGPAPCLGAGDQIAIASPAGTRSRFTVYAFNSFFFSKLTSKGNRKGFEYGEVRRWTLPSRTHTPDCVLTRDLLLFPINHGNSHWCLAAVWPRRRLLQYFDSLGPARGTSDWVLDTLQRWLLTDAEDKQVTLGSEAASSTAVTARPSGSTVSDGWRREAGEMRIPQQLDGCSCGVFVCAFAELLARGVRPQAFGFSQVDVPAIRRGIAEQILRGSL